MPKLLRVVLADDERPARRFLINLLKTFPDVEVVGEAASGTDAIDLIETQKPDLALLDLNMPEAGGLDVARLVKAGATPSIAFVTAYDEFAVQAFELNAIDYLLKPVDRDRLATTLERARTRATAAAADRAKGLSAA
ncbi:MAG: LytR/AlgR family response regulator transcription factor, partial [Vicinamibacterales bacterium]